MSKQKRESGSVKVAEKNVVELDDVVPSVFKEDIFDVFKIDGHITKKGFLALLTTKGVLQGSPRISEAVANLALFQDEEPLDAEQLYTAIRPNISYIEKILKGNVIVPDFQALKASIAEIFEEVRSVKSGNVASYIPQLKRVNPEKYGISVCTADGQQFHLGDAEEMYCVQSTCKPVNYCLALEELGEGEVHNHVGREPSGASFNALTLNSKGLPHNPMINAGAIMSCSLIKPNLFLSDRFDFILDRWRALGGQSPVGFNNSVYLSEKRTADRNFALGYFMREKNAFPDNVNLQETLDFYFQCCSIELSASTHAVVAATLANSGVCPITGEKVLKESTVKDCLSLMYSCGMYDFSGEWAFSVGLPAKSGVSGALIIVIPNVMGISIWSPRLDELGNSVRGIEIARELIKKFNFHKYDGLMSGSDKKDPTNQKNQNRIQGVMSLCWAASQGDLNEVRRLTANGVNTEAADYDGRTALHLAAAEGQEEVVRFLLERNINPNPEDRWGNKPVDDARRRQHLGVIKLLEKRA